jgi:serine/threonine protein kinase
MELCDENLYSMIIRKNNNFTFTEIKDILNQLNNSFKIMHENKIAHRDLKPENILVKYKKENNKNDFIVKLAGYEEAKEFKEFKEFTNDPIKREVFRTLSYMAPEILMEDYHDLKCDLWNLGVILYNLYFREYPYPNAKSKFALINHINNYGQKYFRKSEDKDFDDLISRLLIKNPEERISWEEYFNHPFLPKKQNLMTLIINKNYKIIKELGKGGFGEVILIQAENEYYALKKINIKDLSKEEIETHKNEIKLLSSFNNPSTLNLGVLI